MRFEVEAQAVDEAFKTVIKDFQKRAALPGFRAGKAPEEMILKRFEKDVAEEVKRKLISDSYQEAIKEQKLTPVVYPDIEEIEFNRGQPLHFAATIETAPEFELPEYHRLPAKRERRTVSEQDVEQALNALRMNQAKF